jgi:hypothetical protein
MSERLLESGVFVTGFGYPVVPHGTARVRCQISAAHTRDHLDQALARSRRSAGNSISSDPVLSLARVYGPDVVYNPRASWSGWHMLRRATRQYAMPLPEPSSP